jgi:hypothetical protein
MRQENAGLRNAKGIEYFDFEEDFVGKNIRCIPMIVRFKLDKAGIKLKLSEWSLFSEEERIALAVMPCHGRSEVTIYQHYLKKLVERHTGDAATALLIDNDPEWSDVNSIPGELLEKAAEFNWQLTVSQWSSLSTLQRFALLKLCRPGHENKNFPKAMKEFKLINEK